MPLSYFFEKFSWNKAQIWLHHLCLGHLFFFFVQKNAFNSFHCEVCQFAKHHRVRFPLSNTKSTLPFLLIHTNVWCPFGIPSLFGTTWFVFCIDDCTVVN